jgi:hypothetical protein
MLVFKPLIGMMHIIYCWIRTEISQLFHVYCFPKFCIVSKVILFIQNNVFADFSIFMQFWCSSFQTVYRIDTYDIPLESYWLGAPFSCTTCFQILCGLRADLKIHDSAFSNFSVFVLFFVSYFWTTCRNVPNDIALERYWLGAPFSCWRFFQILYVLSLIFVIRKSGDNADTRIFLKLAHQDWFRCGIVVCWSINRVIWLLIVCGVGQFTQSEAIWMISMPMISAHKNRVRELLEYGSELLDIS